jgi:hypothetical protein
VIVYGRLVKLLLAAMCLTMAVSGCGSIRSDAGSDDTAENPTSTQEPTSEPMYISTIRQLHPAERLQVRRGQVGPAAVGPVVYVELMSTERYALGRNQFRRSVSLDLRVGTSGDAVFDTTTITAWFQGSNGVVAAAPPAPCEGQPLPRSLGRHEEAFGCLGFYLPDGAGKLQIRGDGPRHDPFKYYLKVTA